MTGMTELKFYVCDNYQNLANTQYLVFSLHENDFQENVFEKFLFSKLRKLKKIGNKTQ